MAYQNNSFASGSVGYFYWGVWVKMGICGVTVYGNTIFCVTIYGIMHFLQTIYCRFGEFCVGNCGNINSV